MTSILKVTIAERTLFFEVDGDGGGDGTFIAEKMNATRKGGTASLSNAFDQVIETIDTIANETVRKIKKFDREIAPNEFEIQFGVKLSAEVGAVVAKTAGEAQITIRMTYKHKK